MHSTTRSLAASRLLSETVTSAKSPAKRILLVTFRWVSNSTSNPSGRKTSGGGASPLPFLSSARCCAQARASRLRSKGAPLRSKATLPVHASSTRIPRLRGSVRINPSPGSLLSPPSPQGRGHKSIKVDGPLPWGEGSPQPAKSSAGAGRVRGYFRKIQTPVPFSRLSRQAIQIQRVGPGAPNSTSEFGVKRRG